MSSLSSRRSTSLLAFALILVLICVPAQAAWKGKTVEKDGVTHVMNPATAAKGPETDVISDRKDNLYLLDAQLREIKVYNPDGEHLRTIGRDGEGPGEFRMAFNLLLLPNGNIGVLQTFPSKIVGLTPGGDPADNFVLPDTGEGFKVLFTARNAGDKLAVVYGLNELSAADVVAWENADELAKLQAEWVAEAKKNGLANADEVMEQVRALHKQALAR